MNKRSTRLKRGDKNYVSNKDLYDALVEYQETIKEHKLSGLPGIAPVPDYIAESIYLICVRRANSYNFNKYDFKEDMIGDALIDCFKYLDRFNIEKSKNPFSYFTTTASNAFIRKIKAEKKELYVKYTLIDECMLFDDDAANIQQYGDDNEEKSKNEFMVNYEKSIKNTKDKARLKKQEAALNSSLKSLKFKK